MASGWLSLTPRSSRRRATWAAMAIRSLSFSRGVRCMAFPQTCQSRGRTGGRPAAAARKRVQNNAKARRSASASTARKRATSRPLTSVAPARTPSAGSQLAGAVEQRRRRRAPHRRRWPQRARRRARPRRRGPRRSRRRGASSPASRACHRGGSRSDRAGSRRSVSLARGDGGRTPGSRRAWPAHRRRGRGAACGAGGPGRTGWSPAGTIPASRPAPPPAACSPGSRRRSSGRPSRRPGW